MTGTSRTVVVACPLPHNVAFGGREVLASRTMEALADLGVDIGPLEYWDRSAEFRLLHCFGSEAGMWEVAARAKDMGRCIVVTPVLVLPRSVARERAWAHVDWIVPMRTSFRYRRDLMHLADAVIAQTKTEANVIRTAFGVTPEKIHVIPNAVDQVFEGADPAPFRQRYGADPFVLAVGAIDRRKSQLDLVEASRGSGKRTVIVGDVNVRDPYGRAFMAAVQANRGLIWIRHLDEGSAMIASAYAAADAFVVTSRAEGLPLAALEARSAGAALIMSDLPQHVEVFGADARFFRAGDIRALTAALRQLEGRDVPARRHSISPWTWRDVGSATRDVYLGACPELDLAMA